MKTSPAISWTFEHTHLYACGLGERIRSFRLQVPLTQQELALRAGLHRGTIADLERGRRANICFSTACRLAIALGLPSAYPLLEGSEIGMLKAAGDGPLAAAVSLPEPATKQIGRNS